MLHEWKVGNMYQWAILRTIQFEGRKYVPSMVYIMDCAAGKMKIPCNAARITSPKHLRITVRIRIVRLIHANIEYGTNHDDIIRSILALFLSVMSHENMQNMHKKYSTRRPMVP